ncbi:protein FAR1-RELATED SEQUENCE 5-like [Rhododendron vialii]|uniref:protein FAR1-RELATED SEQUENCE 5-like n=1 Tax=Rhododendron vialii TaxID=182163 RepID=UPI00265E671A|nr:protein FAR1-RELATED SEQUENCE 5-like [Rhododendron vialii]
MQCLEDMDVVSPLPSKVCQSFANSCQIPYIPHVKNDVISRINQEFDTLDAVQNFYNNYAKESGFGTRAHSNRKNGDKQVIRKKYVCCKEGKSVPKKPIQNSGSSKWRGGIIRENCGAKLAIVRAKFGDKYVVSQFVEAHNHPLASPRRCNQEVWKNVGVGLQDLYNTERDIRNALLGQEANILYEYFQIQQQKNSGFMFTMEKEDERRLTHCFWADATSRKSYLYFGDVVIFDTTVNHHRQTTLFGCGLLTDGSSDSFEWLFKEWLKAMPRGPPKMIITDQNLAMTKAFANILPNMHHRYCIWHIVSKFSEKISALSYKEHYDEFKQCIWNSESPEEFEAKWVDVVHKANLSSNEWLKAMYEIRERWIPAFVKHMFSAHMTSSQRAESSYSFFKKYVSLNNSLYDFVTQFARALSHIRHNELDLDHKDLNEKPQSKTSFPMESTMSELYTLAIFNKFQDELFQIGAYMVKMTHEDEHYRFYIVERAKVSESRVRNLLVNKSSKHVSCSCKLFECNRIPCRHLLSYFNRMQILDLPHKFILARWIKSAKIKTVVDDLGGSVKEICDTSVFER